VSRWASLLLSVILLGTAAWADAKGGMRELSGVIDDTLGRPLANVDVELHAADGRIVRRAKTDGRGRFHFTNLPASAYAVFSHRKDFKPSTTIVIVGRTANKIEISLEALQPLSMELTARRLNQARNALSPETGGSVYRFTAETISELPEGDNTSLPKVLIQAPGVNQDISENGGFHVRGVDGQIQYPQTLQVGTLNGSFPLIFQGFIA
jgi:hypothetical protein